ncbi:MAG TPA: ankyrin repeat domain-containing protein [Pyrinomonadaceae bacterium]|jgi:hypothetical protein|nr:ankyrin repeat domain-containing protein [Pyrinomonadaceae bacterium]
MSKVSKTILDRISIPSPCSADWDQMVGNEQVRFCLHCSKHVNNLSEMTRKQALEMVSRSKGRLCVRYYRRPDGHVQSTSTSHSQLYQIKRRASLLATGAFTAVLGLASGVAAQTSAPAEQSAASSLQRADANDNALPVIDLRNATLKATITDPNGAVIPGALLTLVNQNTGLEQTAASDSEGQHRFENLEAGSYTLKTAAMGFDASQLQGITVEAGQEQDVTLEAGIGDQEVVVLGGVMALSAEEPLVVAAYANDLPTVRKLIAAGVDVNIRDKMIDATALDEAVTHGNREMVRVLLDAGAEINARSSRGQTALMRLDDDATEKLVWDLVAAGAKINLRDEDRDTALIFAASYSKPEVLRALIDAGAKINAKNKEGETALMKAAEAGSVENVKLLIYAGANTNARNNDGETALDLARNNEHAEVVELLDVYTASR